MDFVIMPLVVFIITFGIYSLFELFARRKERMMMIEKMSEGLDPNKMLDVMSPMYKTRRSFSSLKAGCLLAGLGLGLVVGMLLTLYAIPVKEVSGLDESQLYYLRRTTMEMRSIIYGGSLLLFGGAGLLAAFMVENSVRKNDKK